MSTELINSSTSSGLRKVSLNILPDEMLLIIFSFLDVEDICSSISAVCKRWNSLTHERTLWKNIKFICSNNMSLDRIQSTLRCVPYLNVIEMQWRTDIEEIVKELTASCKSIFQINMVCCGKVKGETIELICCTYPLLEHFSMEKCWTVQEDCYEVLHRFTHLKSLNISHSRHFNGTMLREVVDSCPLLEHINIDYIREISDDDLLYFIEKKKYDILTLILFGEMLTDASFCSLEKCRKMKKLHISRCVLMSRKGLQSVGKLPCLRSLKLRFGINLNPPDLVTFLLSKAVRDLEYLCLSRCENFTDEAAFAIAENCIKLRHLDLLFCPNLTEVGRQNLLMNCRQLKTLNV